MKKLSITAALIGFSFNVMAGCEKDICTDVMTKEFSLERSASYIKVDADTANLDCKMHVSGIKVILPLYGEVLRDLTMNKVSFSLKISKTRKGECLVNGISIK